jgi:glycosyltransferase involved in cell wall biosynthesis
MQALDERSLRNSTALATRQLDVAFLGFVYSHSGYGTAARAYIHALHNADLNLSIFDCDKQAKRAILDPLVASLQDREIAPELYIGHTEPTNTACMESVLNRLVVLTTWEANILPPRAVEGLNKVLEVWVPCRYNLEVFQRQLDTPVFQIPHPVRVAYPTCLSREEVNFRLGLKDDDYVFLAVATWQERKNLPGIIEAFVRAFSGSPKVKLLIKTCFTFTRVEDAVKETAMAIQRANPGGAFQAEEQIKVFDKFWPEEMVAALMQRADCYLSLHSAEGWCYPLFDAACNGTPVIATGYSGPMDYLDAQHHRLVRYDLTQCDTSRQPSYFTFTPEMVWAMPDLAHAAELMRDVYDHQEQAVQQAQVGADLLKEKFSHQAIGEMAQQRLLALADRLNS